MAPPHLYHQPTLDPPSTDAAVVSAAERIWSVVGPIGRRVSRPGSLSALVALSTLLAIEMIRAVGPVLAVHLVGRGVQGPALGLAAVAPVVAVGSVLALAVRRDPRRVMLITGLVLVVARVALQLLPAGPGAAAAVVGAVSALAMIGLLASLGLPLFGGGVLAGVLLDAALHAGLGTRSLIWINAWWAVPAVLVVSGWYVALLWARTRREVFVLGRSARASLPLVAIGPVLVVEAFMLGHLGWVGASLGWGWLGAAVVVGLAGGTGVLAAAFAARYPSPNWWLAGLAGGGALGVVSMAVSFPSPWWIPTIVLAQVGVGVSLTMAVARGAGTGGKAVPAVALVIGYLLLLGSWSVLDGRGLFGVPVSPSVILVATGILVLGASLVAVGQIGPPAHRAGRAELVSLFGVFIVPAALLVAGVPSVAAFASATADDEVRVVTYNVALALDDRGRPNFEAVGRLLGSAEADVIALQEVPRGYLPGGADLVGWLEQTLGMPHVAFQPSAPGSLHGNAILSRYPIGEVQHRGFARQGTALPRGALAARIELPGDGDLWFVNAHLPPGGSPSVRQDRTDTILSLWGGRERTVVAADLNATAASDIVRRLDEGGLAPTWDPNWGPGETFPARRPRAQIDWIMVSDDVEALSGARLHGAVSDHLAVSVLVRLP